MKRLVLCAVLAALPGALSAQEAGDAIRAITLLTQPEAAAPQEFQAAQDKSHSYEAKISGDNLLSVEEVVPAEYTFTVMVYESADPKVQPKQIAHAELAVSVLADAAQKIRERRFRDTKTSRRSSSGPR